MAKLIYQLPADDLAKAFTPTLTAGAVDPNYPLTNLANDNPALPVKFTGTFGTFYYDFLSATAVPLIVFLHWNVRAGATVTVKADNVNTFDSGSLLTDTPTLTTVGGHGYWPNPFIDRQARATRRYLQFAITGNPANIVWGGLWLSATFRSLTHNPSWGVSTPTGREDVLQATSHGVEHGFNRQATSGIRNGSIETSRDVGFPKLQAWHEAAGRIRATPVIEDPAVNSALFVKWDQKELVPEHVSVNNVRLPVAWRGVSPGEAWD